MLGADDGGEDIASVGRANGLQETGDIHVEADAVGGEAGIHADGDAGEERAAGDGAAGDARRGDPHDARDRCRHAPQIQGDVARGPRPQRRRVLMG